VARFRRGLRARSAAGAREEHAALKNLDSGILTEEFPEGATTVLPNANHFALMAAEPLLRLIDDLVAETRARRRVSTAK
jgi:hypothetical protein